MSMVRVIIDGKEATVEDGTTVLEAAKKLGIEIPTLCYFPNVFEEATCRICVVEDKKTGKMIPSCAFPVSEGLNVETNNERVRSDRKLALEVILAIHKIKCQSCPRKGGRCELLVLCKEYGVEGIPVCAECPLHEEDCLLANGEVCLGPLTVAGCDGICMHSNRSCEGCRGPIMRTDVIKEAVKLYSSHGITLENILVKLGRYYSSSPYYDSVVKVIAQFFNKNNKNEWFDEGDE
ncbi:MAG: 2Fe-2S iron-sulfur cluster-binding protein [Candidatus Bathyarchaeia archaeon]